MTQQYLPHPDTLASTSIGIVFNRDRTEVLCVRRRDIPLWILPGGGIDKGETPEAAAIREVEEETGYAVRIARKAAEYSVSCWLTRPTHIFEVEIVSGEPILTNETSDIGFFPIDRLPQPFLQTHLDWIRDALAHPATLIQRPLHEVTWTKAILWALRHPLLTKRYYLAKLGLVFPVRDAAGKKKRR